jgi:hypothetical protein
MKPCGRWREGKREERWSVCVVRFADRVHLTPLVIKKDILTEKKYKERAARKKSWAIF